MKMQTTSALVLGLSLTCYLETSAGATDANAPKAEAPAAPGAVSPAQTIDWEHMSKPDKKKYMKATVLPEMKKLFIDYDAKAYKKMTCTTCHGDGASSGKFKMPNPKLPKLPQPTSRDDFLALQKKKPEAVKFMGTVVKPKMAELLGLPQWTPATPTGLGCYHCHTKVGEKP
jgi:cytochrome c553